MSNSIRNYEGELGTAFGILNALVSDHIKAATGRVISAAWRLLPGFPPKGAASREKTKEGAILKDVKVPVYVDREAYKAGFGAPVAYIHPAAYTLPNDGSVNVAQLYSLALHAGLCIAFPAETSTGPTGKTRVQKYTAEWKEGARKVGLLSSDGKKVDQFAVTPGIVSSGAAFWSKLTSEQREAIVGSLQMAEKDSADSPVYGFTFTKKDGTALTVEGGDDLFFQVSKGKAAAILENAFKMPLADAIARMNAGEPVSAKSALWLKISFRNVKPTPEADAAAADETAEEASKS